MLYYRALSLLLVATVFPIINGQTITFDCTRIPNICSNDLYAIQCVGKPSRLTRDSADADAHRAANACDSPNRCSGNPSDSNSCDEFPFATSLQGGATAVTRCVPSTENSRQGGTLSSFYTREGIQNGDSYNVAFSHTAGLQYVDSCTNSGNELQRRELILPHAGRAISSAPIHVARRFLTEDNTEILMFEHRDEAGSLDSVIGTSTYLAQEDRYVKIIQAL